MKNKLIIIGLAAMLATGLTAPKTPAKTIRQTASKKFARSQVKSDHLLKEDQTAEEILEKHVAAVGGREALLAIKSVRMQTEAMIMGNRITATLIYDTVGKRVYQKQENNGKLTESGFDGVRAWQKAAFFRGYLEDASDAGKSIKRSALRLPVGGLYDYQTSGRKFMRLPDEEIDGKKHFVLESETAEGAPIKYYLDATTYLIRKTVSGAAVTQIQTFEDYRRISGIMVAFSAARTNPQTSFATKTIEVKFNEPLEAAVFEFDEKPGDAESKMASATPAPGQSNTGQSVALAAEGEIAEPVRLKTFELVWKIVNDSFYDRNFNGVNWQTVHDRYLPLVKTTAKSGQFHDVIDQMVKELRLSHFRVIAPENVATLSSSQSALTSGSVGLKLVWVDKELLVAEVRQGSPAELAEIRPGYLIKKIDGKTPDQIYGEYRAENKNFQFREDYARARAAGARLAGKPETRITIEFSDEKNVAHTAELVRRAQPLLKELEFESRRLDKNIGYIKFNLFFGDLLPKFSAALAGLKDTAALIIDLRGNPGGLGSLAPAVANLLNRQAGSLGSTKYRYDEDKFEYQGTGDAAYQGKIFILTDEGTASTSEVFASGMQENGRAQVIGGQTIGAVLPSLVTLLPTNGALQHVIGYFQTPRGFAPEGKGITPNFPVKLKRVDLLAGHDPVLNKARQLAGKR